jgi:DNA processing protein
MAQGGGTIGVIASGIDVAYPPENAALQEDVAARGLLIAEMPPGTQPLARHFPYRNRIIAGLASGTVVVEAAPRSGSLITARLAGEAGREVMAVPGSPLDSRSRGCNQLIRDGAVLVQSADDVAELLESFQGAPRSTFHERVMPQYEPPDDEPDAPPADIAAMLGAAPVSIDEIIRQSAAPPSAVQFALLELELAGRLQRHAGGRVSLIAI